MAKTTSGRDILAKFFDDGAYQVLCGEQGAVTAAFGSANGTPVYAVCQNGEATGEKDIDKMVKVLEMAATTGNPVVTFYASAGAKLAEGLGALAAGAKLCAAVGQGVRRGAANCRCHRRVRRVQRAGRRGRGCVHHERRGRIVLHPALHLGRRGRCQPGGGQGRVCRKGGRCRPCGEQ